MFFFNPSTAHFIILLKIVTKTTLLEDKRFSGIYSVAAQNLMSAVILSNIIQKIKKN